ncbi:putative UDP-glucuronosyltransferase 2A3 [Podospora appendiculata]|uniref:UDP-glucuronosyltransferase 2A3 n=1 Tax=Podospora appendiculata TaxID=314037 RepID=A0AAE0XLY2_9PEZI|nr:putative UDP-glucuronosyltransferase 2A3 [Podospora appendiculata]
MADSTKPLIVLTCTPGQGHVNPIKTLAKALILEGYEVTAVSSSHYRSAFEGVGCSYVAVQGYGDYWDDDRESKWPDRALLPPGPEQFFYTIEHSFVRVIPDQFAAVQTAIKTLKDKHPARPVVLLNESAFLGSLPLMKGARGVKPDGTIGIGINPVSLSSVDTAPFGPGLPPPKSPEDVAQYAAMRTQIETFYYGKPQAVFNAILLDLGAQVPPGFCFDAPYLWPDRFLQMCPPSTMYPRSDAPASVRYTGGLPKLPPSPTPSSSLPPWWHELTTPTTPKKDIIFVCQGTVDFDYTHLVLPTLTICAARPNTLVIAALGQPNATLPTSFGAIPPNARVADYIPFDLILPHCAVFVGNGGYGGVQHSIAHGTPMVLAGASEDKTEMCAIAAWAGVAVNLCTGTPSAEALRDGIEEVLTQGKYREACERIQREIATFEPIEVIQENIREVVAGFGA